MTFQTEITPTFIVEEHNEAFFIWNQAINEGIIPEKGNFLLHFDEHSDLQMPRFSTSLNEFKRDTESLHYFTYNEIDIATFIIPSLYLEIITGMCWVRQRHDRAGTKEMFVRSFNQSGKKLIAGKVDDIRNTRSKFDNKNFMFTKSHIEDLASMDQPVILDIDLDYFSCQTDAYESRETVVEITREEYERYQNDPYHRMNFLGFPKLYAVEEEGRYYFLINSFREMYHSVAKVSEEEIQHRIDLMINKLKELHVQPALIDICRSRHSGYTPSDQWQFIEDQVIEGLKSLYDIELRHINELTYATA
ncbi:MAG: UPF0489 family protein [Cytophagales bacterium]|nr:UPF0489 family protein [Cytophagales bacterium]